MIHQTYFNGKTGELKIYSCYEDKLLLDIKIPVRKGDIELSHALIDAIRMAEAIAERHAKKYMKGSIIYFLEEA